MAITVGSDDARNGGFSHRHVTGASLEQAARQRIENMSYLPTTVGVAMKFMELGNDPEASPADYCKVISADSSLSTKLLSLANSSWFGVRNKVTKVQVAVNLLGLGTVRTLAVSYCVTGLHNELRLRPEISRMFWAASLCKAVAARTYAAAFDPKMADEAFAAALFQDFALPVMYAVAPDRVLPLIQDNGIDCASRLKAERELFRLDHAELGRCIAQKLELPEIYVDAVAFHHNHSSLRELLSKPMLADACYAASLFPHCLESWNRADAQELERFIPASAAGRWASARVFLDSVQKEFEDIYRYFEQGEVPETKLAELLEAATREVADNTTRLVTTVQELMQQAASAGKEVHKLLRQNVALEEQAIRDPLTGLLNRDGFSSRAQTLLANAKRYRISLGVAYLDIDCFKALNDTRGHAAGDKALSIVAEQIAQNIRRDDLAARIGGDEFALVFNDCSHDDAIQILQRTLACISTATATDPSLAAIHVSAGLVWVSPEAGADNFQSLLSQAERCMYEAKKAGGNQVRCQAIITAKNVA